jgi:MFS family permease
MDPKITNVYVASALATIGGLLQGFDVSSLSAILATSQVQPILNFALRGISSLTCAAVQFKDYFGNPDATTTGGITASMAGGSLLGALFSSWTGDRVGRRDSMFGATVIFVVGSILMCAVQNIAMLIVSRIVNGFAVGIITAQGPVYIAEISPPTRRGQLIALQQWMITWGVSLLMLPFVPLVFFLTL